VESEGQRNDLPDRQRLGGPGGHVREHRVDRRLQRWQLAAEAGIEAVPDLAGGRAPLHRGRVSDVADQVVQVGGGDGPQLQGTREADHRHGDDAGRRQPAPGPGAADGHRERRDPGQDGQAGQFHRVPASGRVPGQRGGQATELIRETLPRVQPYPRCPRQVGLPGANEQRQGTEHSGQRMREPRADRDPGRSGGDHQQQPAGQHRDARSADGPSELHHHGGGGDQQQAGGRGSRQAGQVGGSAGAGRGREAGVQVRHAVAPGPPGGQLRGDQDGHAEDELPEPDPPADVPPQRFRPPDEHPDHAAARQQPGQH